MHKYTRLGFHVFAIRLWLIALVTIATLNTTLRTYAAEQEAAPANEVDNATSILTDQLKQFDTLLLENKPQDAMALFQRMYRKYTKHPLLMAWAGRIAMMQNNAQAANEALTAALAADPDQALANALMATFEIKTGKGPQGKARLDAALLKHPDSPELLQISAELKMTQFDTAGALEQWQKIAGNQNNTTTQRANAYSKIGEIQMQAQKHVEAALALGYALALHWHPQIAAACVQEQYKAQHYPAAYRTYTDFKDKLYKDPRLAQFRAQVLPQFEAIELELNIRNLSAMIKAKDFNVYTVERNIKDYRKALDGKTDQASKDLLKLVDGAAFDCKVENAKRRYEKDPNNLDWLSLQAKEILKIAPTVAPDKATPAIAMANEILKKYESQNTNQTEAALALAKSGWKLIDFFHPDDDKKKILAEKGLPELKSSYSAAGKALKAYYEPFKAQRQSPAFEELALQFMQSPDDAALKSKLADALYEHIRDLNIADEKDATQKVLPGLVWSMIPGTITSPDYSKELNEKSDTAYSLWNNYKTTDPMKAHRWKEIIEGYDRIISVYPKPGALIGRAKMQLYAGNYRQAFEDQAAAVAVAAWERAHTFMYSSALSGTLDVNGVPTVQQFHDIMTGKGSTSGPFASAPLVEVMKNIQSKNWAEIGPFLLIEHNKNSFGYQLENDIKWGPQLYRVEILHALTAKWIQSKDDAAACETIEKQADELHASRHPCFGLLKIKKGMEEKEIIEILENIARTPELGGTYDPTINYMLAGYYLKRGDKELAMFQYNAGAQGRNVKDIKDKIQINCAQKRDELEGTTDPAVLMERYIAYEKDYTQRSTKFGTNALELYRWESVLNRLMALGSNNVWAVGKRYAILQRLGNNKGAISDLEYVLKYSKTPKKDIIAAVLGENYMQLGDYENAIAEFSKAIGLGYDKAWVYSSRGSLYRSAGQAEKAIEDYSHVLKIEPENDHALEQRAELYEWYVKDEVAALKDREKQMEIRTALKAKDKSKDPIAAYKYDTTVLSFTINNLKMKIAQKKLKGLLGE
jgi:Flp pilus assembly protein TadD